MRCNEYLVFAKSIATKSGKIIQKHKINLNSVNLWHDLAPGVLFTKKSEDMVDIQNFPLVVPNNKKIYNQVTVIINEN